MVRLPDSPDEWQECCHTSGRLFLTNKTTHETKWLWQKWELNGIQFVRNIADPSQRYFVQAMDFSMRIATGMATPEEVQLYQRQPLPQPPPPPPSYPPHLHYPPHIPLAGVPQRHGQSQPIAPLHQHQNALSPHLRSQPYPPPFPPPPPPPPPLHAPLPSPNAPFNRPPPPLSYADATKGYHSHFPPPTSAAPDQYNGYPPPPKGDPSLHHSLLQPTSVNPQMNSRFSAPPSAPFHRYDPAHRFPPQNIPADPSQSEYNRDAIAPTLPNESHLHPSSLRFDGENKIPPFPQRDARNHSFAPDFEHIANHTEKRKRIQDYAPNNSGRYWSENNTNKNKKRHKADKSANGKHKQGKSRFAALTLDPKPIRHYAPRPPPLPIEADSGIPTTRDANFTPTSKYAKSFVKVCRQLSDVSKVAMLYNRDLKPRPYKNGLSSSLSQDSSRYGEYAYEAVVGTSEEIEKDYLRLTTAPKPSAVRPPHVLKRSLAHIKTLWGESERDYDWVCRQLKSVRQDYKVQHVESTDVLDAYETHSRIALEKGDLGEFNTCVAQLQELYKKVPRVQRVQDEFTSYRILYNLLIDAREWEQSKILAQFSKAERNRTATRFALSIRQAVVSGNYYSYFKLCKAPPEKTMISYLLDHFHDRVRWRAVSTMVSAYGPTKLPITYVVSQLGWAGDQNSSGFSIADLAESVKAMAIEKGLVSDFNSLNLELQPRSFLKAVSFLLSIGVIFKFENIGKPGIDSISIDCKPTKAAGIKKYEGSKLITHAGAERS